MRGHPPLLHVTPNSVRDRLRGTGSFFRMTAVRLQSDVQIAGAADGLGAIGSHAASDSTLGAQRNSNARV